MSIRERVERTWENFFYTGCSPERLGMLRILIGFGMIPFHALQFATLLQLDFAGRHFHYIDPIWYFEWIGIESLHPALTLAAFVVLVASTVSFTLGYYTRTSLVVMLVCTVFLKGVRDRVAGDAHHRYLIPFNILVFFALSRCGDIYSLDRARNDARGIVTSMEEWESSWPIKAAQLYLCSFYTWSAIAKVRMSGFEWFGGGRIHDLLMSRSMRGHYDEGDGLAYWIAQNEALCSLLGGMTALFEFGFPLMLLIHTIQLRVLFFAGVSLFHVANYYLAGVKFLFMPIFFLLFFDVSVPVRRWLTKRTVNAEPS